MMADYIDRQAAIDAMDVLCQEHRYKIPGKVETYSQYNEAWQDALDRAEGAIGNLPSADVQPVRHGHWEHDKSGATICSVCSKYIFDDGIYHLVWYTNYCPHCGAKMDGERKE